MVIAGVRAGQQVFVAVLDPAHRLIELQRQCREDDLFRIQPRLGSEAAADIGRDHPDAALLDPEQLAERDAHRVRRLGRCIDHDLVQPVVAIRQHAAALHRRTRLAVHAVFAGDRDLGGARGGVDVAADDRPFLEQVVAEVVVHRRGTAARAPPAHRPRRRAAGIRRSRPRRGRAASARVGATQAATASPT